MVEYGCIVKVDAEGETRALPMALRLCTWLRLTQPASYLLGMHPQVSHIERELRREQSSAYNCLLSVLDDARFVDEVAGLYPTLPVFANLRCGLWYVQRASHTCYFKSTDGHNGNWSFSTSRLNLNVVHACATRGGAVIVDATRRGKTYPVRADF
jgi:tRNA A64-2'-O-ribosylphosphate transferase